MAIFGRKLVGKEVLKREPIGYENFSSKVHKLFGHELEKTAAASTITSSYSIAQPPTNNSEHDICKLCNTCASSRPLAFEAEDQILFKRNFSPGFDVPCWP